MKNIGLGIIIVAFLAAAYLTSLDPQLVDWTYFIPTIVVGFIGVALVQVGGKQEATEESKMAEDISIIETSIKNIVEKSSQLDADKAKINTYDMLHKIDDILLDDLNAFVASRESIKHVYSLQEYATVMSHYAAGERYLNRVWSASADGYIDEVNEYIGRAKDQFIETQKVLQTLKDSQASRVQ